MKDRIENFKKEGVVIPRCDTRRGEDSLIRCKALRSPDCNAQSP